MKASVNAEKRVVRDVGTKELMERFGFIPNNGIAFGEKIHDRTLNPNFIQLISEYMISRGNIVMNGVLKTIYTDNPENGGYIEVQLNDETKIIPFSNLILSLGHQRITDENNNSFIDIVNARGVSTMALLYMPLDKKIPVATVCGATNHVTKIAGPIITTKPNDLNTKYNVYLVKLTCAACITPRLFDETNTYYDSIAATGLMSAARKTLGGELDILTVWGCNRQVSRHGELHWLSIGDINNNNNKRIVIDNGPNRNYDNNGIHIQVGAGGGGLTQGPSLSPKF